MCFQNLCLYVVVFKKKQTFPSIVLHVWFSCNFRVYMPNLEWKLDSLKASALDKKTHFRSTYRVRNMLESLPESLAHHL